VPKTKVEFWNVKVHNDPDEHVVSLQSGESHGTALNDEDREGSKARSHGAAPEDPKMHGLHRRLDMPLTSKYMGSCCAGVPYLASTV